MKRYIKPDMEIDVFETEDVITASGGDNTDTNDSVEPE